MIVDIRELRERGEPLFVEADFTENQLKIKSWIAALSRPADARLKVSLSGDRVRVAGHITAELDVTCSRCLKQSPLKIEKNADLEYWPDPVAEKDGEEVALSYDELTIGFYRDDLLDLAAAISEQIVLEIPMKPVCCDECKGLCPQCGTDLNEGQCSCRLEPLDPRLVVLADLKKKMK